jgi:hypothetical protein
MPRDSSYIPVHRPEDWFSASQCPEAKPRVLPILLDARYALEGAPDHVVQLTPASSATGRGDTLINGAEVVAQVSSSDEELILSR